MPVVGSAIVAIIWKQPFLRSSAIVCNLRSAIVCDHMETSLKCGEAGNTTVKGTQLYFTLARQRYKHGGLAGAKDVLCTFRTSDVSNDETKLQ